MLSDQKISTEDSNVLSGQKALTEDSHVLSVKRNENKAQARSKHIKDSKERSFIMIHYIDNTMQIFRRKSPDANFQGNPPFKGIFS